MLNQYKRIFHLLICSYYIKCLYNSDLNIFKIYNGHNAPYRFLKTLLDKILNIYTEHLSVNKLLNCLTPLQQIQRNEIKTCHICKKKFHQINVS